MTEKYDAKGVEKKWAEKWVKDGTFVIPDLKKVEDPFYGLFMFPYPSAEGLHLGHAFVFGVIDTVCKFERLRGRDVFEPVGWDAFGIHSENYALKIGEHPAKMLERATGNFTKQIQGMGIGVDWTRMVDTTKPEYFKWTQWIFTKLLEKGLAVQKEAHLNWCPSCKTVLADEQIEGGECERCGTVPEKKKMKQWFFKTTAFADRLLDGLEEMDWSGITKSAQKNWIGRSEGAEVEFELDGLEENVKVAVIDGFGGNCDSNWKPWIKEELEKKGIKPKMLALPNSEHPDFDECMEFLRKELRDFGEKDVVIGHSLGGLFGEQIAEEKKLGKLILVAPAIGGTREDRKKEVRIEGRDVDALEKIEERDFDLKKVKTKEKVVFFDETDHWIPFENRKLFDESWDVKISSDKGHFSTSSGVTEIPEILDLLFPKKRAIIIHGFEGNGENHWNPWLKKELEKKGWEVKNPTLPNPSHPDFEESMEFLRKETADFGGNDMVVGHSLGGYFALKLAEEKEFGKIVLVAPAIGELTKEEEAGWRKEGKKEGWDVEALLKAKSQKVDLKKVKAKTKVAVFSDNDVELAAAAPHFLDEDWEVKMLNEKGHFCAKDGVTEIPELLDLLFPKIKVFTTRPDTLFGATFMTLAPENELVEKITTAEQKKEVGKYVKWAGARSDLERTEEKKKTGVWTGAFAVNPVNDEKLPIWVADFVLGNVGTGAIMSVPASDARDFEFAKKFDLEVRPVVKPDIPEISEDLPKKVQIVNDEFLQEVLNGKFCFTFDGISINSGFLDGLKTEEAKKEMIKWLEKKKIGKGVVNFRLRDWCISRQRYWGPPVPVIYCKKCGTVPVPEKDLPVLLPEMKKGWEPAGDGKGPLAKVEEFMKVKCPKCGGEGKREADVMDNFLDSAWYFFRYLDTGNEGEIFDPEMVGMEKKDWDKQMTLIFLEKGDELLLAMKKRGLGEGNWNGVGGKVEEGESVKMSAVRELMEELEVKVDPKDLEEVGQLQFFNEGLGDFLTHVFRVKKWEGEPKETEEVKPKWFDKDKLPFEKMWPDDEHWMPEFLAGKKLSWKFWLKDEKLVKHEKAAPRWLPVDIYVGGNEHAVLHLMYTRFITMFLHDLGLIDFDDPFKKFRANGMILKDGKKMSKSKGNVINPEEMGEKVGFDALKSYLLFLGPLNEDRSFTDEGVMGCKRWVEKMGRLEEKVGGKDDSPALISKLHQTIKKVTADLENQKFNTGVAKMMELTNAFGSEKEFSKESWEKFLALVAPFAPAFAEEMWEKLGKKKSIFLEKNWPEWDEDLAREEEVELVVQVNGKVRDRILVAPDVAEEEAVKLALESEKVKGALKGEVKKKIFVPGKLVNLVG